MHDPSFQSLKWQVFSSSNKIVNSTLWFQICRKPLLVAVVDSFWPLLEMNQVTWLLLSHELCQPLYSWMIQNELYSQIYRTCKIHKCKACFGSSIPIDQCFFKQNKQLQVARVWWASKERSVSAAAEECCKNYMQDAAITWGLHGSNWSLHHCVLLIFTGILLHCLQFICTDGKKAHFLRASDFWQHMISEDCCLQCAIPQAGGYS
jgi:hypothetical protein